MKLRSRASKSGFTLIELMIVIAIIAILAAVLVPNFIRARAQGQLTACKSNLRTIATAVEMYAVDNGARYPASTALLTPNYLRILPSCPAVVSDTYSGGFTSGQDPDVVNLFCEGNFHLGVSVPADHPVWNSDVGLIER